MRLGYTILVVSIALTSSLSGCASYSQTFIGPSGEIKHCASSSQSQGLIGVSMAANRFNQCTEDMKNLNYREIESTGTIGISLYRGNTDGFRIMKVYDNSPAARAGIMRGDKLISVNGNSFKHSYDFESTFGEIGTTVKIAIEKNGVESEYNLTRARSYYSRMLEDLKY